MRRSVKRGINAGYTYAQPLGCSPDRKRCSGMWRGRAQTNGDDNVPT